MAAAPLPPFGSGALHSAGLVPRVAEADLRRASSRTGRARRWLGYGRAQSLWRGGRGGGLLGLPPFEEVIAAHGAVVLRVCRAVAGPDDADDAWSETFLSALQAYPRLAAGSNVRGWLVTIAYRKAVDRIRAGRRAPIPAGTLPERPSFDREVSDAGLWRAVAALAPKQRGAVVLHHVGGLPYAEAADLLGTSEAAARRAAADGIAALRKALDREESI